MGRRGDHSTVVVLVVLLKRRHVLVPDLCSQYIAMVAIFIELTGQSHLLTDLGRLLPRWLGFLSTAWSAHIPILNITPT